MSNQTIKTPCVGLCSTVYGDLVCRGCKRFHHEVIQWNGYNEEEKYVDLEQRNNFKVGDKVEFCQPKGELVETVIEKMTDEDGNPIDVAPHAQMKVRIYMVTPLEPYSMMRRECKPKEDE